MKSWPEKSVFSAAPVPICFCFIFSGRVNSFEVVGFIVLQVLQARYLRFDLVWMIRMFLQVGQNWIVILGGGDLGF